MNKNEEKGAKEKSVRCKWRYFGTHTTTPTEDKTPKIVQGNSLDPNIRELAAAAYGEASTDDVFEEMAAIANVIVNQAEAHGNGAPEQIATFIKRNTRFICAAQGGGNTRYHLLKRSTLDMIKEDRGMWNAVLAARNALCGTKDFSNGAYFWDGFDIKTNEHHEKRKMGIIFTSKSHNIFSMNNEKIHKNLFKKRYDKALSLQKLKGTWEYSYESVASYGNKPGTIFWKLTYSFRKATGDPVHGRATHW